MKKAIAIAAAILLFVVLITNTILTSSEDENLCVPNSGSSGSGGVVVDGDYAYPTDKDATQVSSPFGPREGGFHNGVDLAGPHGTPIYAFADGRVINAEDSGVQGFGGWVVIEHNIDGKQIQTVYGHEEPGQVHVAVGDRVSKGDHIADMGSAGQSSGDHLHFEVVTGDRSAGAEKVDPQPWLDKAANGKPRDENEPESKDEDSSKEESDGFGGLSARQLALAKQIVAIGEVRGVDKQGQKIAVAVAKHESQLQVYANDGVKGPEDGGGMANISFEELKKSLDYPHDAVGTDNASVGTFQQQAGMWGSVEELMNPAVQARKFYEHLEKVDYQGRDLGSVASEVQGNATGTGVYSAEEDIAGKLVDHFKGAGDNLTQEEIEAAGNPESDGSSDCGDTSSADAGKAEPGSSSELGEAIVSAAREQYGQPYVWGGGDTSGPTGGQGSGEKGFDCSGLVLWAVFQATNGRVTLPHQTMSQVKDSNVEPVKWEDKQPGDLIYLGEEGSEHHVGIYSGKKDGKDMWIEAQTFGVPLGEYEVRTNEHYQVVRVKQ